MHRLSIMFLLAIGLTTLLPAQSLPVRPAEIDAKTERAILRAQAYLVKNQRDDGSWRSAGRTGSYPVAMTSLAGLSLLAGGHTPNEGRYAINVRKAVGYLLKQSDPKTGLIYDPNGGSRPMFGHGYAMMFLGEAYGMERNPTIQARIKRVLEKAIELTERSQSKHGGWFYHPNDNTDEGAVTVTQIQGLRSARNAGINVPKRIIDRACEYIKICQNRDGGIAYSYSTRGGGSRPAITAAAVAVMYNAGQYENPVAKSCLEYVLRLMKRAGNNRNFSGHYAYGTLYASQAMYLSSEENWKMFYPKVFNFYTSTQNADGSWRGDHVGNIYGTAIGLLVLQLPYKKLPILQR